MKIRLPLLLLLIALLAPFARWAHAEEPAIPLDRAPDRSNDLVALQRGARLFINYCLNSHSAREMRYSRLQALGIPKQAIEDQLLFTADRIGDTMTVALRAEDANEWFGTAAPDLSVIARARGRTGSIPICAASTATTPDPPAGITACLRMSQCRMCYGNFRGSACSIIRKARRQRRGKCPPATGNSRRARSRRLNMIRRWPIWCLISSGWRSRPSNSASGLAYGSCCFWAYSAYWHGV